MFVKVLELFFNAIFDAAFIIMQLSVALSAVIVFNAGGGQLFSKLKQSRLCRDLCMLLCHTGIMFAVLTAINMLLFAFSYSTGILRGVNFSMAILLSVVFYALVFCRYEPRARIILSAVIIAAAMTLEDFGGLFGRGLDMVFANFDSAITKILSAFVLCGFAVFVGKFSIAEMEISVFDFVLNLIIVCVAALGVIFYDIVSTTWFHEVENSVRIYVSVVLFLIFAMDVAAYITTYCLCRDRDTILRQRTESQKLFLELETVRMSENHLRELREIRHDLKNRYAYTLAMLQAGETGKLKKYFEELSGELSDVLGSYFDCGNSEVNAIVNMERGKAASVGVKINTDIVVPAQLPFSEADLVGIMTNVIDNAVEECARIERAEKTICVRMNMVNDSTYLCVTNPTDKVDSVSSGGMATSKEDKKQHGLGMNIVSKLVAKHGGHFCCKIENGTFSAEVLLNKSA